jgi:nitrite reductase/ring-hydroxylating ferredoxin subunit
VEAADSAHAWRCAGDELGSGRTATFQLQGGDGVMAHGFIVNHGNGYCAYVNRCPHAGTPLDWWPNEFFTEDGRHLICATHGAIFAPETGVCVEGPCPGARLQPMRVERDGDGLVVTWPA